MRTPAAMFGESFTDIAGQPYTSFADRYNKSGAQTFVIYDYTDVTGQNYYAYQLHDNLSGATLTESYDLDTGGHQITGFTEGVKLQSHGDDVMTGGSSNETFFLKHIFGADTITDFATYETGMTHDIISLSKADFSNFTAVKAGAANSEYPLWHFDRVNSNRRISHFQVRSSEPGAPTVNALRNW